MQRRHLAPTHKSTLYLPDTDKDSLVIDKIPDFFVTGHIHRVAASNYRNITMLSCSCWLEKTEFQEKLGLHPQPGRAILVNLQTRKVKILKFYDDKDE
ncbi:DNA polymerase II small subunit, partial [Candidatus Woesearchaeota archaeon]|nr:DNA polymerase II small subunit [Candidatus Woesearchaeota archaeon]